LKILSHFVLIFNAIGFRIQKIKLMAGFRGPDPDPDSGSASSTFVRVKRFEHP
jgi:hypothetical protein